ncbi:MAG TPA: ETX/MTX2 family pore-forming toxin [Solirubrobacterales bacterium]|nr:ETX/MTX2 family pore-forming toxin [Solirubrobacterales bacterium]
MSGPTHAPPRRSGWSLTLVALLLLAVLAIVPPPSLAGQGVTVRVHNYGPETVTLLAREGSNCWEAQGLVHPLDQNFTAPGTSVPYVSEKKTGGGCSGSDGHQRIQLQVKEPGGSTWYVPNGSPDNYTLYWQAGQNANFGTNFYDGLGTWLPRQDGAGLICWHTKIRDANYADVFVYSDANCNTAVPVNSHQVQPKASRAPAAPTRRPAMATASADDNTAVVDLLSTVGVACQWYVFAKEPGKCAELDVGNEGNWTINNVSAAIRKFNVSGAVGTSNEKYSVGSATEVVPLDFPVGKVAVSESVSTSETSTTATTRGFKIGGKLGSKQGIKTKVPFIAEGKVEVSQEINGEYNFAKTETEAKTNTKTRTITMEAPASPGFATTLDVFTTKRDANYFYDADLSFGADGVAQNVTTPATLALGQSPARRQPCLAYVVGDSSVRNSITFIGQQLFGAGYTADDSSLSSLQRGFLESISGFKAEGKPCPGFPAGYASMASFKGRGVGTYASYGYDDKGNPVQTMVGCVYRRPLAPPKSSPSATRRYRQATAAATATDSPCQQVPIKGTVQVQSPGTLIDARAAGGDGDRDATSSGTRGSDRILGPRAGGTVRTGAGALDIVYAGEGDTEVHGDGGGENIIYGAGGDDLLIGGHGKNYFYGAAGRDRMVESGGEAIMYGGGGNDSFKGDDMTGVMIGGKGDNRMVAGGDMSGLAMTSGPGDNVYVLNGTGTPEIVQLPGPGRTTVITNRSLDVPAFLDVAVARGSRAVTLRGGEGNRRLLANDAGGTLVSGPEPTRLQGGDGGDTIVFNATNGDVATGGPGADRYRFTGAPESSQRPPALERPAQRTAATVTDFAPRKGDRLVLTAAVFGSEVLKLRRSFTVVAKADPWPRLRRPTLLLDTDSGVLSFDRDGAGPISDKVIVKLPGRQGLERRAVVVRRAAAG